MIGKLIRKVVMRFLANRGGSQGRLMALLRRIRNVVPQKAAADPLRGSGSWDMAYAGGQTMQPLPSGKAAARVAIHPEPMMNGKELALFQWLFDRLEAATPTWSLHAQVSMGAFLRVDSRAPKRDQMATRGSFAQKRVDFLVVDETGLPVVAIEYHGSDHFQGDYQKHDAGKAQALEEAGISLLIITEDMRPGAIWQALEGLLELDDAFDDTPVRRTA
jgi:hypothetical protein